MLVGFNHNVMYKGEIYHVQTEDSGIDNPQITTLLYHKGTILASRKVCYADIIKMENLEKVVEELMKDQHKELMRSLKNGAFDDRIAGQPEPVATSAYWKVQAMPSLFLTPTTAGSRRSTAKEPNF